MTSPLNFSLRRALPVLLLPVLLAPSGHAQPASGASAQDRSTGSATLTEQTFSLPADTQPDQAHDVFIALRTMLAPNAKISPLEAQNAILIRSTPSQLQLAQKIIDDLYAAPSDAKAPPASEPFVTDLSMSVHTSPDQLIEQTFYLPTTVSPSDAHQALEKLRETVDPRTKLYLVMSRRAIVMNAAGDQLQLAQKTLGQLYPAWFASQPSSASVAYDGQSPAPYTDSLVEQTLYVPWATERNSANEVLVALRNMLYPSSKIFLVGSHNAILIEATSNQLQLARKIVADLDPNRPAL